MRDGVELIADHYAPTTSTTNGTILLRGPYGRSAAGSLDGRLFAARGYHVVFQSCRGTFGSGGTFEPMVREVDDGHDTVEWLRGQPWFDGRLATMGLSYLGFTQWALLMDPPPELRTAVIRVGPHDFSEVAYGTGAFSLNDFLGWSDMVARQEDQNPLRSLIGMATASRRLQPGLAELPLADAAETVLHGRAPWYRDWLSHPDRSDAFWARMQLGAALDNVQVPVALVGGWQDLFLDQTLAQYAHLHRRGINVALTVGPWTAPPGRHARHGRAHTGDVGLARRAPRRQRERETTAGARVRDRSRGVARPAGVASRDARGSALPSRPAGG